MQLLTPRAPGPVSSQEEEEDLSAVTIPNTQSSTLTEHPQGDRRRWKRFPVLGKGIYLDLKDRLPYYISDWTDSWDYRVIPSLVETYFNNLLPAIAFAQDMFDRTDNSYGVNEILLSSAMGGVVFGALSGQPLCIVGVTGPIAIFHYTVYEIIKPLNTNYFGFMFWIDMWAMIFHLLMAFTNSVALLQFVTTFPCDIFGMFINVVYIEKGIQILGRQFHNSSSDIPDTQENISSGFASVVVALLMMIFGITFKQFHRFPLFTHRIRTLIADYSIALSVVFWSGFIHFGGYLNDVKFEKLPISKAYFPSTEIGRDATTWLAYTKISTRDVFIALPFGLILTILFYFDHNVSSLMAQRSQYKLKKPSSFHYDFALLGLTTCVAGVLGIPPPNGLIPQAPLHTESLLVLDSNMEVVRCVEQRFTNTVQGLMMLGTMTRPLLVCLSQIPQAVLSGLFFVMGIQGLMDNVIVSRIIYIFTDSKIKDTEIPQNALQRMSKKSLFLFVTFGTLGAAAEVGITNTIAAIGFPLILLLTVIVCFWFPKIFTEEELEILDPPVAQTFTIKNLLIENLCGKSDACYQEDEEVQLSTFVSVRTSTFDNSVDVSQLETAALSSKETAIVSINAKTSNDRPSSVADNSI
ncbi:Bor1p KNAG_0F00430 [Huiozyma naganishii CBS 8797]|uniref:Bicarbonate transporter-like transmembrane domain-containing protein n=1 Tax=Huiozyma naganishii (strain ATCC MYA-139 / BCRC 22969 / CBS 8797 / KCTC 17520 / NBRC 10181 / NCYC 3082 / Yp74L-3) TaxID=1071383 RepID=J7RZP7_HUIN7|nr:hypothetical protein KNAG_0F00430 [Kazachstania naganishii CBS 8797]CCK70712.1 hypothetical protein KNAG_0F00430 [Kazachstania naganishii CBS 8797]